jgi:hypothetical protein
MSVYANKIDKGLPPDDPLGWLDWLPPPGYEVDKLRDFTQPMPEDGSCALCGKVEPKCPCYKHP